MRAEFVPTGSSDGKLIKHMVVTLTHHRHRDAIQQVGLLKQPMIGNRIFLA